MPDVWDQAETLNNSQEPKGDVWDQAESLNQPDSSSGDVWDQASKLVDSPKQAAVHDRDAQAEELFQKKKQEQNQGLLPFIGESLLKTPDALLDFGTKTIPSVVGAVGQVGSDVVHGKLGDAWKDISTSAESALGSYPQLLEGAKRFVVSKFGPGYTDQQLRDQVEQDMIAQEAQQKLAQQAAHPENVNALGLATDPINLGLMFAPGLKAGIMGLRGAEGVSALGKTATLAEMAAKSGGNKYLTGALDAAGKVAGKTGELAERGQDAVQGWASKFMPNENVRNLIESHIGGPAAAGAMIAGPHGAAVAAALGSLPETTRAIGSVARAASRALKTGESSIPFFEAIARDTEVSGIPKAMATFLSTSPVGRILEGAGRTVAGAAGSANMKLYMFDLMASGGDPDQAANNLATHMSFAMGGHGVTEPFRDNSRAVIALKQTNDVAAFLKTRTPAELGELQKWYGAQGKDGNWQLAALAQIVRANPKYTLDFTERSTAGNYDPSDPYTISLSTNSSSPNWLHRTLAHEIIHGEGLNAGLDAHAMSTLIGDPSVKKNGFLVSYDQNGVPTPSPEFQGFIERYTNSLQGNRLDEGVPAEQVNKEMSDLRGNLPVMAGEWLAESLGSKLASFTNKGELVYTRLRRNSLRDAVVDRILGRTVPNRIETIFGIPKDGQLKPRFGAGLLPPEVEKLYTDFIRDKGNLKEVPEGALEANRDGGRAFSVEDIRRQPKEAAELLGASNSILWSVDENGEHNGIVKMLSDRQAQKVSQEQGNVFIDAILNSKPTDNNAIQKRFTADGRVEYSGKYISDDVLNTIEKSGKFNKYQMDTLRKMSQAIQLGDGSVYEAFYQSRTHNGNKYVSIVGKDRTFVPMDITISQPNGDGKGFNVLFHVLNFDRVEQNLAAALKRAKKMGRGIPFGSVEEARAALPKYLQNHELGYGGTGEPHEGAAPTQPPAIKLTSEQRNFLNEVIGVSKEESNPFTAAVKATHGAKESGSAINFFRLDAINQLHPRPDLERAPVQYPAVKFNYSPSEPSAEKLPPSIEIGGSPLQVSLESVPGSKTGVLEGFEKQPLPKRIKFMRSVKDAILNGQKRDEVAEALNLKVSYPNKFLPGAWEGQTNPFLSIHIKPEFTREGTLDPGFRQRLQTYAAAVGLSTAQAGVGYSKPFYTGDIRKDNAIYITFPEGVNMSYDQTQKVNRSLDKVLGKDNYALINDPYGTRFAKFTNTISLEQFELAIARALDYHDIKTEEHISYNNDGELVSGGDHGEQYQQRLSGVLPKIQGLSPEGSPSVQSAIDSLHDRVAKVYRDEADRGGYKHVEYGGKLYSPAEEKIVSSPEFKKWFGESKVVDEDGHPIVVYSGHSNAELYGDKYQPKKGTAGAFYSTEDPQIASNYALGKMGVKEYYENGDQYRFPLKNGKFGKKLWQMELTPEQQEKAREFLSKDERGIDLEHRWKENAPYEADSRRALARGGLRDLQSIWKQLENDGYNIAYAKENNAERTIPLVERQTKSTFEELLDHLGIKWQSHDWHQPGVLPVYLSIKNPIDAAQPFPADLLAKLKEVTKRKRNNPNAADDHWTKDYPLKQWVKDIEDGNEYWSTQVPPEAIPIMQSFGYDGIKEVGRKTEEDQSKRQVNWIAFEPTQIKSAVGNKGTFDPENPSILHSPGEQDTSISPRRLKTLEAIKARKSKAVSSARQKDQE